MKTTAQLFETVSVKTLIKERKRNPRERDEPFNELYSLYTSPTQKVLRKKENWKRYRMWLMSNRIPHTKENTEKFRKLRTGPYKFIEEYTIPRFAYLTAHFKLNDLFYILSVARDRDNRNQSIGAWLFSHSLKIEKLSTDATCTISSIGV